MPPKRFRLFFNLKGLSGALPRRVSELRSRSGALSIRHSRAGGAALGKKGLGRPIGEWSELVARSQDSVVTPAPNDLVREFRAANGKLTTVIVKSPKWFKSPSEPLPSSVRRFAMFRRPTGITIGIRLWRRFWPPQGVKPGCDVVRLAPNSEYRHGAAARINRQPQIMF